MSRPYYVWQGKDVIVCSSWDMVVQHNNYLVYDPEEEEPDDRWGLVQKGRWWPRDVASIPLEFRTKLLIMGAYQ